MKGLMSPTLVFGAVIHVLTIVLFLRGFFPEKKNFRGLSNHSEVHQAFIKEKFLSAIIPQPAKSFDRMVFMVIDALRDSFIFNAEFSENMNFTHHLLSKGHGRGFIAKATAPTVTLPRIKAIVTGGIPGFFDVIENLNANMIKDDNWVNQIIHSGKKISFFGDGTWIKLFPNHFIEYDGTTSFFVSDYKQVDDNVTRHLDSALNVRSSKHANWDVMILHYLGLDHLGHTSGPYGPLVPAKLCEMDETIEYIHRKLVEKDSVENKKSVLIVCGDHGMSDSGGHGGSTMHEVSTPFLILPAAPLRTTKGKSSRSSPEIISQIDIAPTVSAFMGVPIPKNNLGRIVLDVMELPVTQRLYWLFANAYQVYGVFQNFKGTLSSLTDICHVKYKNAIRQHRKYLAARDEVDATLIESSYMDAIKCLGDDISSRLVEYDMFVICVAILYFILGTYSLLKEIADVHKIENLKMVFCRPASIFLLSSYVLVIIIACTGCCSSSVLCGGYGKIHLFVSCLIFAWFMLYISDFKFSQISPIFQMFTEMRLSGAFVIFAALIQIFSLGSSSFVEEEHQVWYFFVSSWCLIFLYRTLRETLQLYLNERLKFSDKVEVIAWLIVMLMLRICRKWNQTGNKWIHLYDIGDYLNEPENHMLLSVLIIASMIMIGILFVDPKNSFEMFVFCTCLYLIMELKIEIGPLSQLYSISMSRLPVICIAVRYLLLILLITTIVKVRRKPYVDAMKEFIDGITKCWFLLSLLLCRSHNVPLYAMVALSENILSRKYHSNDAHTTFIYLWFAATSFFLQGNSGSLSTVDVPAGYVGLTEYEPVVVGMQLVCNTYALYVFWLLKLFHLMIACRDNAYGSRHLNSISDGIRSMSSVLLTYRSSVLLVFSIIITSQRYHLFIWTVFSPKLLYEAMSSVIVTAFIILISLVDFILCRIHKFQARL